MSSVNPTGSTGMITWDEMQGMDLETMIMAVQANRANQMDEQIMTQMEEIQFKNEQMAELNSQLTIMTEASQMSYGTDDPQPSTKLTQAQVDVLNGLNPQPSPPFSTSSTKADLDTAITQTKGQVDALNSNSQMDMLRLQSLADKRNEAYDTMTNFLKKFHDQNSGIIGNMR